MDVRLPRMSCRLRPRGWPLVALLCCAAVLSACTSNQAKISMLQAPEIGDAARYKSIAVACFAGVQGDVLANELEAALVNARVQDEPVYRLVARSGELRHPGGDLRSLAPAAKSLKADAILAGEVLHARFQDDRRQEKEYVCDQSENPKKFVLKCISGHYAMKTCIDRTANLQVQVRLVDAQTAKQVYAESISRSRKDSACQGAQQDGTAMLGELQEEVFDQIKRKIVPHDKVVSLERMDAGDDLPDGGAGQRFAGAIRFAREGRMDRACAMFAEIHESDKRSVALNDNLGVCEEAAGAFWQADEYYRIADRLSSAPNKLLTAALERNAGNLKKAGNLARHRSDLLPGGTGETAAARPLATPIPGKKPSGNTSASGKLAATALAPMAPKVSADMLMLGRRTALVIGNTSYRRGALLNPVNDARAIAAELRRLQFQVVQVEDASFSKMDLAIEELGRAIKEGGVAFVFYAEHGMQVKDENFLIPVDADLKSEGDVPSKTIALGQMLSKLEDAGSRVNLVVLDACRDNPFARSWRSTRGGLASVDAPAGTLIAFATAPGKTAADGSGANGLYTSHLLREMGVPNQKIEDALKNARKVVAKASNSEQIPWESSSLTGDFYFKVAVDQRN